MVNILTETPLFQALFEEREHDLRLEIHRQVLLRVIKRKFGELPENLAEAVHVISDTQRLQHLLDLLIDTPDLQSFHHQARSFLTDFIESRTIFDLLQDTPPNQQQLQAAELRGELRGRVEGLRWALVRQLTHHFRNLPDTLLTTVQAIDKPERLELLLDALLDAPDLQSFKQHL